MTTVTETHLSGARLSRRGKVRELYDLGSDPDELKKLIDEKKHAKRLATLREAMAAELKRTNAPAEMRK